MPKVFDEMDIEQLKNVLREYGFNEEYIESLSDEDIYYKCIEEYESRKGEYLLAQREYDMGY